MNIKWKRPEDSYVESYPVVPHNGHYEIHPMYNHSTRPQWYQLYWYPEHSAARRVVVDSWCDTQSIAKARAERHYRSNYPHVSEAELERKSQQEVLAKFAKPIEFRLVYENGYEIVTSKDIFTAAAWAKEREKVTFRKPLAIEQVDFYYNGPKPKDAPKHWTNAITTDTKE